MIDYCQLKELSIYTDFVMNSWPAVTRSEGKGGDVIEMHLFTTEHRRRALANPIERPQRKSCIDIFLRQFVISA
jgi:hypothetical protein